jgi:hypothetical protein
MSLLVRSQIEPNMWIYADSGIIYSNTVRWANDIRMVSLPDETPEEHKLAIALMLRSQLRCCMRNENGKYCICEEDLQAISTCPIMLGSILDYPPDIESFKKNTPVPPPEHGTAAIHAKDEKIYYIHDLPEQAQERQKQISQMLAECPTEPTKRSDKLVWDDCPEELIIMIQQLAQDYYQYHLQHSQEGIQKRPSTIDPSLPSGDMYSPSCFPVLAVNAAIWGGASGKKRGWKRSKGQGPQFEFSSKNGDSYTATEYNTTTRETAIDDTLAKELWEQLDQYRDHDVDAFAIALAYSAKTKGQSFWIFGDDILDHRGKVPRMQRDAPDKEKRPAGQRQARGIQYGESFRRLSNTWVNIRQVVDEPEYDKRNRRRKQRVFTHAGRLLMVEEVWYQKEFDPDTGETINGHVIGWKIRVGEWLQTYLEFPNEQIALLSSKILKYDPHNHPWEKRLGYYFFVHGHISNSKGGGATFNREIEDLLDTVSLDIDSRFPQRTKDRFEKAMNRLKEDGIISDWHYKEDLGPPSKRWQEQWLKSMITIHIAPRKALH